MGHPTPQSVECVADLLEKFPHGGSGGGVTGDFCYAEALEHQAEDALVLV